MKKNEIKKGKKIASKEQRQLMLDMLKYIDKICRDNKIRYSLIGGSLIGAIRHHGYIPWDDDIDIGLMRDDYYKLKRILDGETGIYQTLKFGSGGERFPFLKFVDTRTIAREPFQSFSNYGVFVDIFCYYPVADNPKIRLKNFKKIDFLRHLFSRKKLDFGKRSFKSNVVQLYRNTISRLIGYKRLHKIYNGILDDSKWIGSDYIVVDWPIAGYAKEIQLKKNTEEYIDTRFENLTVMIFKNYDEILRTTFDDYMQLPPKSKRTPKHNLEMWWKA